MAKQLVSPVERHVEKVILGIAGIVLIGAIARYLVTSPSLLDLDGKQYSPSTIDERVSSMADQVRTRTKRAVPTDDTPEPLYGEFVEQLKPFEAHNVSLQLPAAVSMGPEVPLIDPHEVLVGQADLVKVVQLDKPAITFGRSTFDIGSDPINWVTVSAVLDRKGQRKRQARMYGPTRMEVVFAPPELQRRARRPEGSWSDDDWDLVDSWPAPDIAELPDVTLLQEDGEWIVTEDVHTVVSRFAIELEEPLVQMQVLRPLMPDVVFGSKWKFPIITSYHDVILQDDEYFNPLEAAAPADLVDRYELGELELESTGGQVKQLSRAQQLDAMFKNAQTLLAQAQTNLSEDDATEAYNLAGAVKHSNGVTPGLKSKADRLMRQADQARRDIQRKIARGQGRQAGTDDDDQPERELGPTQQLWVHDARPESIESGKAYQYRIRARIYNNLAVEPTKFADPRDAEVLFVEGQWSEPSDPVEVEADLQFFVTGADEARKTVSVDMFHWFEGFWVTNSSKFKFSVGDALKRITRVEIQDHENPEDVDRAEVMFDAGAVVLDIDYDRPYRERRSRGGGVEFASPTACCSVVLVDSAGNLRERFVPTDKADPTKSELTSRVWKAPRKKRR